MHRFYPSFPGWVSIVSRLGIPMNLVVRGIAMERNAIHNSI